MDKKEELIINIDKKLKDECGEIFEYLGLDLPTAIQMFLRQVSKRDGFPFPIEVEKPSLDTIRAMIDAEDIGLENGPKLQNLEVDTALARLKN